uniref:PIPK domain-containing protein n=1 Tax=Anisakis simplex TaxID=6269 RepID=A0A0M3KKA2_ANISI
LIVMRNIFGRKYKVHRKYDLKVNSIILHCDIVSFVERNNCARDNIFTIVVGSGIHDMDRAEAEAAASQPPAGGDQSDAEASGDELVPTPPDSPLPSTGAFAPIPPGGPDLDDEFFAISSNPCSFVYI